MLRGRPVERYQVWVPEGQFRVTIRTVLMPYLPVRCVVRFNNTDFPGGDVVEMTLGIWVVSHGSWKEGEVRGFPGFGAAMMLSNRLFHRKSLFSRESGYSSGRIKWRTGELIRGRRA